MACVGAIFPANGTRTQHPSVGLVGAAEPQLQLKVAAGLQCRHVSTNDGIPIVRMCQFHPGVAEKIVHLAAGKGDRLPVEESMQPIRAR